MMASKPRTTTRTTAIGKTVPPWKRTFLPLPREASLATFLADDDEATKKRGYRLGESKRVHRLAARRRWFNSTISSAYILAMEAGDAAASTHSRPETAISSRPTGSSI